MFDSSDLSLLNPGFSDSTRDRRGVNGFPDLEASGMLIEALARGRVGRATMSVLEGKAVILGVTGGIAAYKAATLASLFVQAQASVEVVMTESARQFVQPLTFSALTHRPVHTDTLTPWHDDFAGHVSLADRADLVVVAPATATTIARLALGLGDDLLSLVALSSQAPLLIAPAMEARMYMHPATQQHLGTLAERGARIVGPDSGRLASGAFGRGRMADPADIVHHAEAIFGDERFLEGFKIVVTAGGTREPLDPVRYLGNRSSGRMGFALARAASIAGAEVTLISGTSSVAPPLGPTIVSVETAQEMLKAVELAVRDADMLIMAAAVADFRPATLHTSKIKKASDTNYLDVRLVRNPDILGSVNKPDLIKIGFAAETENLIANAAQKLVKKNLAMIVANDASSTIGADESTATVLTADGGQRAFARMPKDRLAVEILRLAATQAAPKISRSP